MVNWCRSNEPYETMGQIHKSQQYQRSTDSCWPMASSRSGPIKRRPQGRLTHVYCLTELCVSAHARPWSNGASFWCGPFGGVFKNHEMRPDADPEQVGTVFEPQVREVAVGYRILL